MMLSIDWTCATEDITIETLRLAGIILMLLLITIDTMLIELTNQIALYQFNKLLRHFSIRYVLEF